MERLKGRKNFQSNLSILFLKPEEEGDFPMKVAWNLGSYKNGVLWMGGGMREGMGKLLLSLQNGRRNTQSPPSSLC